MSIPREGHMDKKKPERIDNIECSTPKAAASNVNNPKNVNECGKVFIVEYHPV